MVWLSTRGTEGVRVRRYGNVWIWCLSQKDEVGLWRFGTVYSHFVRGFLLSTLMFRIRLKVMRLCVEVGPAAVD